MAYSQGYSNPFGFRVTPWVKRLLIANAVVFVVLSIDPTGVESYLQFDRARFLPFVWTPVTYLFVHGSFFHLLFNMLALFFFGPPLEERWGSREFVKFYLLAGLGGAILSVLTPYPIIGASGAVLGVMVAFAMYWPDNPIYIWGIFPVKAKYLVGFVVGIGAFYALTGGQSNVAHLAHLGGAIAAFGYLKSPWAPSEWGEVPTRRRSVVGGRDWRRSVARLVHGPAKEPVSTPVAPIRPRKPPQPVPGDDVDQILEKISKGGLSSLTDEERKRLEDASRRYRTN